MRLHQADRPEEEETIRSLRLCWDRLAGPFTSDAGLAAAWFEELVISYSAPDRHYHRLAHIRQVLDTIALYQEMAANPAALQWAAWLHDVVYDTRASDNEERSAAYAGHMLPRLGVPRSVVTAAEAFILQTKTHQASGGEFDSRLFLDADLAILGALDDSYNAYARAIRQEYAWVPEPDYRNGRARVLRGFLQRPRIYLTEMLFAEREQQARLNLEREIAVLEQSRF
jgi:predicted metal-dependent HD superfamily phosphohydrolase